MSQTALTIGTEYAERLLIGTGTESDPWIIGGYVDTSQDLQNLLDAIGTSGAYIKLVKDIDAAQNITYREGIDHYINIACAKLYADEKVKISGMNIKADHALSCDDSAVHNIKNVQILNTLYYGTGLVVKGANSGGGLYFKKCDLGIKKYCEGGTAQFSNYAVDFDYCSIDFDAFNYSNSRCNIFATTLRYYHTIISYNGNAYGYSYFPNFLINNADRVGITGSIQVETDSVYLFSGCSHCYFAGKIENSAVFSSIAAPSSSSCLICVTEKTGIYDIELDSSLTELSAEQLKDREYLFKELHFLP